LRTILIRKLLLIAFAATTPAVAASQATDSLSAARRVVAAASLAAQEYALGVAPEGGRLVAPEEVDEARLFIDQARHDIPLLPSASRVAADSLFAFIGRGLDQLVPPAQVRRAADALIATVTRTAGGSLEPAPGRPASLARGERVYRVQCAACHGATGRGDGPKAKRVKGPPPANLADTAVMGALTPVDIYRKLLIGVAGTAMPGFEETLSDDDRWAVTAYVATLPYGSRTAAVFAAVRRQVDSAIIRRSSRHAFDAYLTFEQVETELRAKDPALARRLENDFTTLRDEVIGAELARLTALRARIDGGLAAGERALAERGSPMGLFAESFLLMLREGFEAILILGALLAFLTKAGAPERRRDVLRGALAALVASLASWVAVEWLFEVTPAQREALEGFTMVLATVVLFWVSYWLLTKIEVRRWNAYVKDRMRLALASGSGLALASVAFLAVYREGLETILFYKALFLSASVGGTPALVAGIAVGALALVGLYLAINAFGVRLPTRPFFALTSAMLYYMAFVFAGKGIAELQAGGYVGITPVEWAPRLPQLGIYPTAQTLVLQGLLLALAIVALLVTWRRARVAVAPLSPPSPPMPPAPPASQPAAAPSRRAAVGTPGV
jgi:high-affinity iron transporter